MYLLIHIKMEDQPTSSTKMIMINGTKLVITSSSSNSNLFDVLDQNGVLVLSVTDPYCPPSREQMIEEAKALVAKKEDHGIGHDGKPMNKRQQKKERKRNYKR